jgi:aryl-alcohol dehydrogenase-like predicted oxidoreductase
MIATNGAPPDTGRMTPSLTITHRPLGTRSGETTSALGMGCWAIGGPWRFDGRAAGWGAVDDDESIRAIRRAVELGVTLFDTADAYGAGHSERVLGRALAGRRDEVTIATKVGLRFDEHTREGAGADVSPAHIRAACEASLRRLATDRIDLYLLHGGVDGPGDLPPVIDVLEELVAAGKVRWYGASSDDPAIVEAMAQAPHAVAVEQELSIFAGDPEVLAIAERTGLASLNRSPLAMGLLTGTYALDRRPGADDVRRDTPHWDFFDDDAMPRWLERLERVRAALTFDGRTLAQGALGWLWARSEAAIPIPGFRTVEQVEANAAALSLGPLPAEQAAAVDAILATAG